MIIRRNITRWITIMSLLFISASVCSKKEETHSDVVDLSSKTEWSLSIDGGKSWKGVIVPGGGCNSDLQPNRVSELEIDTNTMIYRRSLTVPKLVTGQV